MKETSKKLNWGIIGLGKIAHAFVKDLQLVEACSLVAVASRSQNKATEFAQQYQATKAYSSYTELFQDPEVDIVYIATPHNLHASLAIEAMNAGKHVLCEKPLAVNRVQVSNMIEAATQNQVFLMEAFWSRFNPSIREIIQRIDKGELGKIKQVSANFSFHLDAPIESRAYNMDLAGGALLDVGVYPIFLAYVTLGMPSEMYAISNFHETGADLQTTAILKYDQAVAHVMGGFETHSDMRAEICGTKASVFIEPRWHETRAYSLLNNETKKTEHFPHPFQGKGFIFEIEECLKCIHAGKLASDLWSWQNSLDLIQICDDIRKQIGLRYPFEGLRD